jgi:hypothetical protein
MKLEDMKGCYRTEEYILCKQDVSNFETDLKNISEKIIDDFPNFDNHTNEDFINMKLAIISHFENLRYTIIPSDEIANITIDNVRK